jgi:hypothetical protein
MAFNVELPDGTVLEDIPDGTSQKDIVNFLKKAGHDTSWYKEPAPAKVKAEEKDPVSFGMQDGMDTALTPAEEAPSKINMPGSVLDGMAKPEPAPLSIESRGAPVSEDAFRQIKKMYDLASPEKRAAMEAAPGAVGSVAKTIGDKYRATDAKVAGIPVMQNSTGRFEDRTARRMQRGADLNTAKAQAIQDVYVDNEESAGSVKESTYDFDTKNTFEKLDPVTRGVAKGVLGVGKGLAGIAKWEAELLGADSIAKEAGEATDWVSGKEEAIGNRGTKASQQLESIVGSITQQLPILFGTGLIGRGAIALAEKKAIEAGLRGAQLEAAVTAAQAGVISQRRTAALAGMYVQSFGNEYADGREKGLSTGESTARAGIFAAFEVIGEKFGLSEKLTAWSNVARGKPTDELLSLFGQALAKELPSELLTTTGQFLTDKLPKIGLNPQAGWSDYLQQMSDTLIQTVGQSVLMGGAGITTAAGARKLQELRDTIALNRDLTAGMGTNSTQVDQFVRQSLDPSNAQLTANIDPIQLTAPILQAKTPDEMVQAATAIANAPTGLENLTIEQIEGTNVSDSELPQSGVDVSNPMQGSDIGGGMGTPSVFGGIGNAPGISGIGDTGGIPTGIGTPPAMGSPQGAGLITPTTAPQGAVSTSGVDEYLTQDMKGKWQLSKPLAGLSPDAISAVIGEMDRRNSTPTTGENSVTQAAQAEQASQEKPQAPATSPAESLELPKDFFGWMDTYLTENGTSSLAANQAFLDKWQPLADKLDPDSAEASLAIKFLGGRVAGDNLLLQEREGKQGKQGKAEPVEAVDPAAEQIANAKRFESEIGTMASGDESVDLGKMADNIIAGKGPLVDTKTLSGKPLKDLAIAWKAEQGLKQEKEAAAQLAQQTEQPAAAPTMERVKGGKLHFKNTNADDLRKAISDLKLPLRVTVGKDGTAVVEQLDRLGKTEKVKVGVANKLRDAVIGKEVKAAKKKGYTGNLKNDLGILSPGLYEAIKSGTDGEANDSGFGDISLIAQQLRDDHNYMLPYDLEGNDLANALRELVGQDILNGGGTLAESRALAEKEEEERKKDKQDILRLAGEYGVQTHKGIIQRKLEDIVADLKTEIQSQVDSNARTVADIAEVARAAGKVTEEQVAAIQDQVVDEFEGNNARDKWVQIFREVQNRLQEKIDENSSAGEEVVQRPTESQRTPDQAERPEFGLENYNVEEQRREAERQEAERLRAERAATEEDRRAQADKDKADLEGRLANQPFEFGVGSKDAKSPTRDMFSEPAPAKNEPLKVGTIDPDDVPDPTNNNGSVADAKGKERLLIVMCSDSKTDVPGKAIDVYTGPIFQSLRKALGEIPVADHPKIVILSAKLGWIDPDTSIDPYNEKMTPEKAAEFITNGIDFGLRVSNTRPGGETISLRRHFGFKAEERPFKDVMMIGGSDYQDVMDAAVTQLQRIGYINADASINDTLGEGIGGKRKAMVEWMKKTDSQESVSTPEADDGTNSEGVGASDKEVAEVATEFRSVIDTANEDGFQITHVFDAPAKDEVVRINDRVKVYHKDHGWMTPEQAKEKIEEWREHALRQGEDSISNGNAQKVVLSLFDLTGSWSQPWEDAGYQVYRFDIQEENMVDIYDDETGEDREINMGDIRNFSINYFNDIFGSFDGNDIHAILAACPCTDFANSGARHFAAKDADGRTIASVELVHKTLATIEYFKPAVWAIENPVGRIENLGGLPPWRLSFDPNAFGEDYTKKTLLWGRFNGDLPIAPAEATEGSKMWSKYGGKSLATKNARSATPEGFAYSFFMANNFIDHMAMSIANKYDRLDRKLIEQAVTVGATEYDINNAVEDAYYQEIDDDAANAALRELIAERKASPVSRTEEAATQLAEQAEENDPSEAATKILEGDVEWLTEEFLNSGTARMVDTIYGPGVELPPTFDSSLLSQAYFKYGLKEVDSMRGYPGPGIYRDFSIVLVGANQRSEEEDRINDEIQNGKHDDLFSNPDLWNAAKARGFVGNNFGILQRRKIDFDMAKAKANSVDSEKAKNEAAEKRENEKTFNISKLDAVVRKLNDLGDSVANLQRAVEAARRTYGADHKNGFTVTKANREKIVNDIDKLITKAQADPNKKWDFLTKVETAADREFKEKQRRSKGIFKEVDAEAKEVLSNLGYSDEDIDKMTKDQKLAAIKEGVERANNIGVLTEIPASLLKEERRVYYISSGDKNAMRTLRVITRIQTPEGFRREDNYVRNLAIDEQDAIYKAKLRIANSGVTVLINRNIELNEYERSEKPADPVYKPDTEKSVGEMTDEEVLLHFGMPVLQLVSKAGKPYWAIKNPDMKYGDLLTKLGFASPFRMDKQIYRSVFDADPSAKLADALRNGGVDAIDNIGNLVVAKPTLTAEETEALFAKYKISTRQDGNKWYVDGKTFELKDAIKAAGGKWEASTKQWVFTGEENDPAAAIAFQIRQQLSNNDKAGSTGSTTEGNTGPDGQSSQDERHRDIRAREDGRKDERLTDDAYFQSVTDETRALIESGLKFGIPEDVMRNQVADIGMIKEAFKNKKPAFILANEAGTGKTFVLGGAIREIRNSGHSKFIYVTMNQDLIAQIKRDLDKYGVDDVTFYTYSDFSGGKDIDTTDAVLVFDESHNVKNVGSGTARADKAQRLMADTKMTIFASATPFENPVEAMYLEGTNLFAPAGGFNDWAKSYGASVKVKKFRNPYNGKMQEEEIIYWAGKGKKVDGAAARQWFFKQGVMTQRPMKLDAKMVDVSFKRNAVAEEYVKLYNDVSSIYATVLENNADGNGNPIDKKIYSEVSRHRENVIKRILEASKVPAAIASTKEKLDAGRNVVIFVETKADRTLGMWRMSEYLKNDKLHTFPEMQEIMAEWQMETNIAKSQGERGPPRPFAEFIFQIAQEFHNRDLVHELPSTSDEIIKAFGKDDVAVYTGAVTGSAASKNKADFLAGKKRVLVATMAKGGTGLSLHDTVGNRPTSQVNINLPWKATGVDQVAARVARYGLKSKANIEWLFASNIDWEATKLAPKVGARMREMGAIVKGIEVKAAEILDGSFDFEGDVDAKQDANAVIDVGQEMPTAPAAETGFDEKQILDKAFGQKVTVNVKILETGEMHTLENQDASMVVKQLRDDIQSLESLRLCIGA